MHFCSQNYRFCILSSLNKSLRFARFSIIGTKQSRKYIYLNMSKVASWVPQIPFMDRLVVPFRFESLEPLQSQNKTLVLMSFQLTLLFIIKRNRTLGNHSNIKKICNHLWRLAWHLLQFLAIDVYDRPVVVR